MSHMPNQNHQPNSSDNPPISPRSAHPDSHVVIRRQNPAVAPASSTPTSAYSTHHQSTPPVRPPAITTSSSTRRTPLIVIAIIVGLLILGGIGFAIWRSTQASPPMAAETPAPKKKKISVPSNIIAVADRPHLEIQPFQGINGRSLRIVLNDLRRPATTAEYLMEYEVGGATAQNSAGRNIAVPDSENPVGLQGSMGEIPLGAYPSQSELLLGTCSAGGACVLNTGLSAGDLTITFSGGEENYAVASPFTYFENTAGDLTIATTTDQIFTLESAALAKVKDYVITQSAGLPAGLPATPTEIPGTKEGTLPLAYQLAFTTEPSTASDFSVSIEDKSGDGAPKEIYAYSQATETWTPLAAQAVGTTYSAAAPLADIYVLVSVN